MLADQRDYDIRCEWGLAGLNALLAGSEAVVIVDVLSFTTCVDIAVSRGAIVYPYRWRDQSSRAFAEEVGAIVAESRRASTGGPTLSPASLLGIAEGTRLVLPSPNGSTLSLSTGEVPTFAGCLRNVTAVARAAASRGGRIAVIPAGERWPDGSLRPSLEDMLGAGAIISHLPGSKSPEAEAAAALFERFHDGLPEALRDCGSGRELIEMGFPGDVELAAMVDVSGCAPMLMNGAYSQFG
jgi:2-phosphosulfolactate phosphatase